MSFLVANATDTSPIWIKGVLLKPTLDIELGLVKLHPLV